MAFVDANVLIGPPRDPPSRSRRATAVLASLDLLLLADVVLAKCVFVLASFCGSASAARGAIAMSSRSRCGLRDMTNREPTATTNLDKTSETEPLPWKRARDLLDAGALAEAASFLGTVRPDGRPHSARIGAAWYDGNVYFQTGQQTRKARNLEVNPACTLSTSLTGIDLVFEGLAERITDGPTLEAVAAVWREGGWAAEVSRDGIVAPYNAPGTGPPPWQVYRVAAHTVFGVATAEPYGATRWQF